MKDNILSEVEGKEFDIWIEGYAATGESSGASYIGKSKGIDFEDACRNFRYPEDIVIVSEFTDTIIRKKGMKLNLDKEYYGGRPSIWACRLFDNEADARKSFG